MTSEVSTAQESSDGSRRTWTRPHLLGLEDLSGDEILAVLDTARSLREVSTRSIKKVPALRGKVCVNLFFENSTRTKTSFSLAAQRLSADVLDFSVSTSSVSKGETLRDTARNIEAMGVDAIIIRHRSSGAPHLLARSVGCSVINAGDGSHEHPTQGLLDLFTMREHLRSKGRLAPAQPAEKHFAGLHVAIVGDIANSRVARSNVHGLAKLGAKITLVGPATLVPGDMKKLYPDSISVAHDLEAVLPEVDVLNMLRIQFERLTSSAFPSVREYSRLFGLTLRTAGTSEKRPAGAPSRPDEPRAGDQLRCRRRPELGDSAASDQWPGSAYGGAVPVRRGGKLKGRRRGRQWDRGVTWGGWADFLASVRGMGTQPMTARRPFQNRCGSPALAESAFGRSSASRGGTPMPQNPATPRCAPMWATRAQCLDIGWGIGDTTWFRKLGRTMIAFAMKRPEMTFIHWARCRSGAYLNKENRMFRWRRALTGLAVAFTAFLASQGALQAADTHPAPILNTQSVWHIYTVLRPPMMQSDQGCKPLASPYQWVDQATSEPPEGWNAAKFDDATWLHTDAQGEPHTPYAAQLFLRGRFEVTDPAQVKNLKLSVGYHGGVIVFLNGKEVGRGHLAKDAKGPEMLAESYPRDAFVTKQGNLAGGRQADTVRERTLQIEISAADLHKGVNLLGIEVVRSPYDQVVADYWAKRRDTRELGEKSIPYDLNWYTCEIQSVQLAGVGSGIVANVARPKGLQAWNSSLLKYDTYEEKGDPCEPLLPVKIEGPRNGWSSGKVVIGSTKAIQDLKVTWGDFKQGGATIPASAMRARYAVPFQEMGRADARLESLLEKPLASFAVSPSGAAVVPIWLTVKIPATAKPGLVYGPGDNRLRRARRRLKCRWRCT